MIETTISLLKLAIPALAALGGVWLQSRLSRRSSISNRVWDLKREAYSDLLTAIREAQAAELNVVQLIGEGRYAGELKKQQYETFQKQQTAIRSRVAADSVILPMEVMDYYDKVFRPCMAEIYEKNSHREEKARATARCLGELQAEITKIARDDLAGRLR